MTLHLVFEIAADDEKAQTLHVSMSSATGMTFDISFAGKDYTEVIRDICRVAPSMMSYDADLMETYDDAGRTKPNPADQIQIEIFMKKYHDAMSNIDIDFLEEE